MSQIKFMQLLSTEKTNKQKLRIVSLTTIIKFSYENKTNENIYFAIFHQRKHLPKTFDEN